MTHKEALHEARRRWGDSGDIEYRPARPAGERYVVGTKGGAHGGVAYGKGGTYDDAFANADAQAVTP
jgi:hypothetical protein